MDRFIVSCSATLLNHLLYLKSNMDRFIDTLRLPAEVIYIYLKSNMDRFIVNKHPELNTTDRI